MVSAAGKAGWLALELISIYLSRVNSWSSGSWVGLVLGLVLPDAVLTTGDPLGYRLTWSNAFPAQPVTGGRRWCAAKGDWWERTGSEGHGDHGTCTVCRPAVALSYQHCLAYDVDVMLDFQCDQEATDDSDH